MHIGIDFDNTIASYDALFHKLAREQSLIGKQVPADKTAIRDHLRRSGREAAWTALQGIAYGVRLREATIFDGFTGFVHEAKSLGWQLVIVSHKTRQPVAGPACDLHAAAHTWLQRHGLGHLPTHFELTREEKLHRILALKLDAFIDDLPELLTHSAFPTGPRRVLFDPGQRHPDHGAYTRLAAWSQAVVTLQASPTREQAA